MDTSHGRPAPPPVSAWQAMKDVHSGSRVYLGGGCATPLSLVDALESERHPAQDLEFLSFVTGLNAGLLAAPPRHRQRRFFVGSDVSEHARLGLLDYVPIALEDVSRLLAAGRMPIDLALLQVSPPDANGFVSLGVSVDLAPAVLQVARRVVAEVNPEMPRTHGESFVHVSRFDALVDVAGPVMEYRHPPAGDAAVPIARYLAALIEDGATLQVGLGRLPNAVLPHLTGHRDLGIHSDVISESLLDLIEAGAVTGARKAMHRGRIVASYALGTRRFYDALDDNPLFAMLPIEQVCDPRVVSTNPRAVSLTQAFAVDLTGQACVDYYEGRHYGGVSTQAGFLRGAARSEGGKAIICLASTSEDGTMSRIRARLAPDEPAGIARSDVHYVVTEFGIAYLFGRSIRERALALIEIAHPSFRESLLGEAKAMGLLPREQYLASQAAYPVQEERSLRLRDGADILIRPARAGDAAALQSLFHRMSEHDRYTRFFRRMVQLSFAEAQALCNVNHDTEVAFLAVHGPREAEEVIGSGCYFLNPTTNLAEVAFMVAAPWQGIGVGSALQQRLQEYALSRGVRGFVAEILPENRRMFRLASGAAGRVSRTQDEDGIHVEILFADQPAA